MDFQGESRTQAVQGIRSITSWWYWQTPSDAESQTDTNLNLLHVPQNSTEPNTERLKEAVAKMKSQENARPSASCKNNDEYWTPMLALPSALIRSSFVASSEPSPSVCSGNSEKHVVTDTVEKSKWDVTSLGVPSAMSVVSALIVARRGAEMTGNGLSEHIGGSMALEVVNSFEMQVVLAGITWFVIGLGIVGMFEVIGSKGFFRRQ